MRSFAWWTTKYYKIVRWYIQLSTKLTGVSFLLLVLEPVFSKVPGLEYFSAILRASEMIVSLWCENLIALQAKPFISVLFCPGTLIPLVADIITILLHLVSK